MKKENRHGPLQPTAAASGQKLFRLRERDDWVTYGPIFTHVMSLFGKGIIWSFEFTMKVRSHSLSLSLLFALICSLCLTLYLSLSLPSRLPKHYVAGTGGKWHPDECPDWVKAAAVTLLPNNDNAERGFASAKRTALILQNISHKQLSLLTGVKMCGEFEIGGRFDEASAELQATLYKACSTKRATKGAAAEVWLPFVESVRSCVLFLFLLFQFSLSFVLTASCFVSHVTPPSC